MSREEAQRILDEDKEKRTTSFLEGLKKLMSEHNCELEVKLAYIDNSVIPSFIEELIKKQIVVKAK